MRYIILLLLIVVGLVLTLSTELCLGIMTMDEVDIPIALNDTDDYTLAIAEIIGTDFGGLIIFMFSLASFSYLLGLYRKCTRKQRTKSSKKVVNIESPFTLYLRSFADEKSTKRTIKRLSDCRSEEEMLIDVFSDIAPVYAIGAPSDKKMPYGATRIYVDDSIWKETVEQLAIKAEIVILRLGQTNNFWWEVNMALKKVPIDKIVFVIPWSKNFNNVSTLYKILLEHNIDISSLDVNIEKKRLGSISSVLFFINGKPESREIIIPKFTSVFLSYDNMLRNALADFREKFGFKTRKKLHIIKSRILSIFLILIVFIGCGGKFFGHLMILKYQRPYELVEKCVQYDEFSSKYGPEINRTNLARAIAGCNLGRFLLNDEDVIRMFLIEYEVLTQISHDEYKQLNNNPFNSLLMVKKYASNNYTEYINIATRATLNWVKNPDTASNALNYYKQNFENLPQWVQSFFKEHEDEPDEILDSLWTEEAMKHVNDSDFADVIKTIKAQNFRPE